MQNNVFNPMEIDAIGEIMNISLGSSATAVSNMLDHRVDITTPRVAVVDAKDLSIGELEPAVGVEIRYVSGVEGSNIMLLRRSDVKTIVDILMGTETPDEEFELNELTISAVCEVMNQMMGAASTALSDFLGRMVNISTPQSFELDNFAAFKEEHFPVDAGNLVVVRFTLSIEGALSSEFINVISVELARELIAGFGLDDAVMDEATPEISNAVMSQEQIEQMLAGTSPAATPSDSASSGKTMTQEEIEQMLAGGAAEQPASAPSGGSGELMSDEEIQKLLQDSMSQPAPQVPTPAPVQSQMQAAQPIAPGMEGQAAYQMQPGGIYPPPGYGQPMPGYYPPPNYYYPPQPEPKKIMTSQPAMPQIQQEQRLSTEQTQNLDLIMSVPLEVTVEIGRTQRKVQEILTFSKGSLVVLDKLAGDQVDLFVNGQCIARGDVVVVDDNFGIRITEILTPVEPVDLLRP